MKARKLLYIFLMSLSGLAYSQVVGIGTETPDPSTALDITSTKGGLLIPRMGTTERDAIATPATGLMVFNTDTNCVEVYTGTAWFNLCWGGSTQKDKSSNGSAIVIGYNCYANGVTTPPEAGLVVGTPADGQIQKIKASVTTIGDYDLKAVVNGVIFAAKGTFAEVGDQEIQLAATGQPAEVGVSTFILNTVPNCRFERTVN